MGEIGVWAREGVVNHSAGYEAAPSRRFQSLFSLSPFSLYLEKKNHLFLIHYQPI